MKSLGLQSYRFSTSWARVCPDGGPVNAKGLDFYSGSSTSCSTPASCRG